MKFKIGDKVKCVDGVNSGLITAGEEYTIKSIGRAN